MDSPPGLDLRALASFLESRSVSVAGDLRAEVIAGGRSNLTYSVSDGAHHWVVRRPPLAHVLPTAHDMAREWRVISALQDTEIPVPGAVMLCEDASVIGASFYVMDFVDGHVIRDRLPDAWPGTAATRQPTGGGPRGGARARGDGGGAGRHHADAPRGGSRGSGAR